MFRRQSQLVSIVMFLFLLVLLLVGCGTDEPASPTTVAAAPSPTTASEQPTSPPTPSPTDEPTPKPTVAPSLTPPPAATAAPTPTASPIPQGDPYLDDRSDPAAVLRSLVDALNRREFVRAYSYWEDPESLPYVGSYPDFAAGYADTTAVQIQMGTISGGVAAGNTYYSVPVILTAQTTQGGNQTFSGCYTLHLGSPAAQGALPFRPLAIQSAEVQQVANNANPQALLASACAGVQAGQPLPPATPAAPDDVSAGRYLDDRSSGVQIIRSYFNAVNLHEYVRAYSYWENQAGLGSLESFIQGYENTASIELYTGQETADAGAGQYYYTVPVVLAAQTTAGQTQTFAGCYVAHLANPGFQAEPPFRPLGIISADIRQVAGDVEIQRLLNQACAGS